MDSIHGMQQNPCRDTDPPLESLRRKRDWPALIEAAERRERQGDPAGTLYLGIAHLERRAPEAALPHFFRLLAREPDHAPARYNLGLCLKQLDRHWEAAQHFRLAIDHGGDHPDVWIALGQSLSAFGEQAAAIACFERALGLAPDHAEAFFQLAKVQRHHRPPVYLDRLQALVADTARPVQTRARMAFALGKILDDTHRFDAAFQAYRLGNRLLGPCYDEAAHARYDAALRAAIPGPVSPLPGASERPVLLVVGMPRSGTTLLERFLTRHLAIASVGERPWLRKALEDSGRFPAGWERLSAEARLASGHRYLAHLPTAPQWILDKTPLNGFFAGPARQVLAGMKVIFCRRDPMDVGLSCFFQCFTHGHEYSRDLHHLGLFMRRYLDLLGYWRARLPLERWLTVDYEDLVTAPEPTLRRVLDFLDLPWEPACLDHRGGEGVVTTASQWQVRQPLYTHSIGRWRHYARWLGPLEAGLSGK